MARKIKSAPATPQPAPEPVPPPAQTSTFELTDADDTFTGTAGQDVIYGEGGSDTLDGSGGSDVVFGRDGADALLGGAGNDYLNGGAASDVLTGGEGADVFAFYGTTALDGDEPDVIRDFSVGAGDRIVVHDVFNRVSETGENPYEAGYVRAVQVSGGVHIQVDADGGADQFHTVALLEGLSLSALDNDWLLVG